MKKIFFVLFILLFFYSLFSVNIYKYKLKKEYDQMTGITWYKPKVGLSGKNIMYLYIGKKGTSVWLRLKIKYYSSNWLFVNKYILLIDGERFTIELSEDPEREVKYGGSISEISDILVDVKLFKLLEKIAYARKVVLRYNGKRYYYDKKIKMKYILIFKNVIRAYRELGGTL